MANTAPSFVLNQIPSVSDWESYFSAKVDGSGGVLTNGTLAGTIAGTPTWSGLQTFAGGAAISGGGSLAGIFSGSPTWSGLHTFSGGASITGGTLSGSFNLSSATITGGTFTGITFSGNSFSNAAFTGGGSFSGTFTGTPTWSGLNTFSGGVSITGGQLNVGSVNLGASNGNGLSQTLSSTTGVPYTQTPIYVNYFFSGTNSGTGNQNYNTITVNDNVSYSGSGQSNALAVTQKVQANATRSGGLWAEVFQTQAPLSPFGFATALTGAASINFNCGGTGFSSLSLAQGAVTTLNTYTTSASGATFLVGIVGYEMDIHAQSGSSIGSKTGLLISRLGDDAVAGSFGVDTAVAFDGPGPAVGWDYMIGFGSYATQISYKPTATLIKAFEPQTPSTGQALAAWGIDLSGVTFSGGFAKTAGFSVDGAGNVVSQNITAGGFSIAPSGSTLTVSMAGQVSSLTSIQAGGSGWAVGDKATTASGGLYVVTAVSAGVATAVTQIVPGISASPPSNPVSTTPTNQKPGSGSFWRGVGAGLTLNLSWSSATGTVAISPGTSFSSGIGVNGATPGVTGISLGAVTDTAISSTGKHLTLHTAGYGMGITSARMNYVVPGGSAHVFNIAGLDYLNVSSAGATLTGALTINGSGPTISSGVGAATGTQPSGSIWLRTDGSSGSRVYISAGGGTWSAIAGV